MSHYHHLSIKERESILKLSAEGKGIREISRVLGRSAGTISRELKRNSGKDGYWPTEAEKKYRKRRKKCCRKRILDDLQIKVFVQQKILDDQWSPEQIAYRAKLENSPHQVSYPTIYRAIYAGRLEVRKLSHGERGIARKLRHRGKTRHRKGEEETRGKLRISHPIDERPQAANDRSNVFSKGGFATKQEAIAAGVKAQNEYLATGVVFKETTMSYADCLDNWMENYVKIRCLPTTVQNYTNYVRKHVLPTLGQYRLTAIRHETVQRFVIDLYRRQYARSTIVNLLGVVSCSMRYAKRQGWIQVNPAEDIDLPSRRESTVLPSKQRDSIPREVIAKILERFPEGHPSHLPIMLAYHCGLRKGEVFGLSWDMIDLDQGILYVRRQMQRCKGHKYWQLVQPKYSSDRRIRLDPVIWDLLQRTREYQLKRPEHYGRRYIVTRIDEEGHLGEGGEEIEMVIIRDDGKFMIPEVTHNISYVVRNELGYELFDFHSLRHTHATELCENGVNLKEIQRRLGHKSVEVTNRIYLHATDAMERESMEIMKKMYGVGK